MTDALGAAGADPGRIHSEGLEARHAVETARGQVAGMLGARPREVVFTSGATEAITMACWGAARRSHRNHSVLSAVEHSAVQRCSERGSVTLVSVDRTGRVDPNELISAITDDTCVVHL